MTAVQALIAFDLVMLGAVLGIFAFVWRANRASPRQLAKKIVDIDIELGDFDERLASLAAAHKRLNARIAMRQARAAQQEDNAEQLAAGTFSKLPGESDGDWKRRCRAAIADGRIKHHD